MHALCRQLLRRTGLSYQPTSLSSLLHFLTSHGAVYDSSGQRVDAAVDERVESGMYNRALAGTDHYRHNCKADSRQQQQPTQHKHGIATETLNRTSHTAEHGQPARPAQATAGGEEQQGALYEADREKLQLSGGWEEAVRLSLGVGMDRVVNELDIQMTQQERVHRKQHRHAA